MGTAIKRSLQHHEDIIEAGVRSFIDVGRSLMAIRDEELYKENHDTFESYCKSRWGFTRQRAYQYIESTVAVEDLSRILDIKTDKSSENGEESLPKNEGQAKALIEAAPDAKTRAVLWKAATKSAPKDKGGKPRITAAVVKKAAEAMGIKRPRKSKPKKHKENGQSHATETVEREPGDDPVEEEHDDSICDALDIKVLAKLRPVFSKTSEFRSIINEIGALRTRISKLNSSAAGGWLPMASIEKHLDELQRGIKFSTPHTECPKCRRKPEDGCKACQGTGWITETAYNQTQTRENDEWLKNR